MKAKRLATSTDPGFEHPRVDKEFLEYIPIREGRDKAELTALLMEEGCREPVIVWDEENIVVDGHRRSSICAEHGIPYRVEYRHFESRQAVLDWMRRNQLYGKRNLTDTERSYLIGKDEAAVPKVAGKNKVSHRKVQLDRKFAKAVDAHEAVNPGTKNKILEGTVKRTQVLKTAPIMCERCIRIGRPVVDCKACADEQNKRRKSGKPKPVPKNLFETVKPPKGGATVAPPVEIDPFEELKALVTKLAGKFTAFLTADGEVSARFAEYAAWCGLIDHGNRAGMAAKFIPLAGVRAVIEMAGSKGAKLKQADVIEAYKQACGAVLWVPPATQFRRDQAKKGRE